MSVPTSGETFAKLVEHIRKAQEECATMAHLEKANDQHRRAYMWLAVSENMKRLTDTVTKIATGRLQ